MPLLIAKVLNQEHFVGRAEILSMTGKVTDAPKWCVCVPARDEQEILPATLRALEKAVGRCSSHGAVVFVANNTTDATASLVREWAYRLAVDHIILEIDFDREICGAPHTRRLAFDIAVELSPSGMLLTTDADTIVAPDWIVRTLDHFAAGADLVSGAVEVDEDAIDALRGNVRRCGAIEAAYFSALDLLWQDLTNGTGPAFKVRAMGASLAIRANVYRQIGGLPTPMVAEDKALAKAVLCEGFNLVEASDVRVRTSCRINARAIGGMADALRERAYSNDPLCDEALVPVSVLKQRAKVWNGLGGGDRARRAYFHLLETDGSLGSPRMRMLEVEQELRSLTGLATQTPDLRCAVLM